jgi:hypothetical protein
MMLRIAWRDCSGATRSYRLVTFGQSFHWTDEHLGPAQRVGQGTASVRTHRFEDVLARTRFGVPRQIFVPIARKPG